MRKQKQTSTSEDKAITGFNTFVRQLTQCKEGSGIIFTASVSYSVAILYTILRTYFVTKPEPDKFPIPSGVVIEKIKRNYTKFNFDSQLDLQKLNTIIVDRNLISSVTINAETSKTSISIKNNSSKKVADNNVPEL